MAKIVGGIATAHTPTIGFAVDSHKENDPVWAPIFKGYEPIKQWLKDQAPDVLFYVFNDHMTSFFIDHYSHFTLGVGEEYPCADEGGGPRKLPPFHGDPEFAQQCFQCLLWCVACIDDVNRGLVLCVLFSIILLCWRVSRRH